MPEQGNMLVMLVSVWHLELSKLDALVPPAPAVDHLALTPVLRPSPGLARFLYVAIGTSCRWETRVGWSPSAWQEWLDRDDVEYWVFWWRGRPAGFAELNGGRDDDRGTTLIKYLGLLPDHRGRRLGGHLLTSVARRAWTTHRRRPGLPEVSRVTVHTSELDSPRALPNYEARGFQIVRHVHEDR